MVRQIQALFEQPELIEGLENQDGPYHHALQRTSQELAQCEWLGLLFEIALK
jgi:hypothetical protein